MTTAAAPRAYLPSLTGLRAVAALGIFCFHAAVLGSPGRAAGPLTALGPAGVSFFFVLSGHLLAHSALVAGTEPRPVFWRRRLARIYPVHLVLSLAVVASLTLLTPAAGSAVFSALPSVALVQAWLPDFGYVLGGNGSSWPLACEVFFYAAFPALWAMVRALPRSWLWPAAGCAIASVWAVAALAHTLVPDGPPLPQAPFTMGQAQLWAVYVFPPARLPEFVLGMLTARLVTTGRTPRTSVGTAAALLCGALVAGWSLLPQAFCIAAVTVLPVALLIRAAAAADLSGVRTPLTRAPVLFLGRLSYPFCQAHAMFIAGLFLTFGTARPALTAAAALPPAVAAAWLLHRYVERPCAGYLSTGPASRPGGPPSATAAHQAQEVPDHPQRPPTSPRRCS